MWNGQTELKMGWKEGWMGVFIGGRKTSGTAHVEEVEEVDRDCAYIGFRWPGCERVSFGSTFFFFSSLCIFSPLFFFPPSPIRSSLYRSNDSRYLRRCYRTALLSKEFICNCAVLMSEGDVRWYRNCFRMIDDGQM